MRVICLEIARMKAGIEAAGMLSQRYLVWESRDMALLRQGFPLLTCFAGESKAARRDVSLGLNQPSPVCADGLVQRRSVNKAGKGFRICNEDQSGSVGYRFLVLA